MNCRETVVVGITVLALAMRAPAASLTWDVAAGDVGVITEGAGNWSDGGGNWNTGSGDVAWSNATPDSAIFGGGTLGAAGTVTLTTNIVAGGLTFNAPNGGGSYTLSGSPLTVNAGGIAVNASVTVSPNVILGATQTWTVADGQTLRTDNLLSFASNTLTVACAGNAVINSWGYSAGQGGTLTKTGAGTLTTTLNLRLGGNPDVGNVNVQGGVLSVQAAQLFDGNYYCGSGALTVSGGGVLELQNWLYSSSGNLGWLRANADAIVISNGTIRMTGTESYGRGFTLKGAATLEAAGGASWSLPNDVAIVVNGSPNLTLTGGGTGVFGKVFYGGGALTKNGTGTWTLTGANTSTGITTVAGGTLRIGNGGTSGAVAGAIVDQATLVFDRSSAWTIDNAISGTGTVVKAGAGIAALTASNSWSGGLLVHAGGVEGLQSYALGSGWVEVVSNALLSAGPATAPSVATLTAGALKLNSSRLPIDLGPSNLEGGGGNDLFLLGGDLTLSGTNLLQFRFLQGGPATNVPYTLIRYAGARTGGATNLLPEPSRYVIALDDTTANEIRATFNGAAAALVWRGDGASNAWDIGLSTNWVHGATNDFFYQGDAVTFDESGAAHPAVALQGVLVPSAVMVSGSSNYTFTGSGSIGGGTGLAKTGSGTLTLAGDHAYTGATTVNGGTLVLNDGSAGDRAWSTIASTDVRVGPGATLHLGASAQLGWTNGAIVTVNGGQLVSASNVFNYVKQLVLTNGATVAFGAGGYSGVYQCFGMSTLTSQASAVGNSMTGGTIQACATFDVSRGTAPVDLFVSTALADYAGARPVTKTGNGVMRLAGNHTYSGNTTVNGGRLELDGMLYSDAYRTCTLTVSGGATLALGSLIYGSGNLGQLRNNTPSMVLDNGTLEFGGGSEAVDHGFWVGAGGGTLAVTNPASTLTFNAGNSYTEIILGGPMTVSGAGSCIMGRVLSGTGSLTLSGTGVLGLTNNNTYTGVTRVDSGTLILGGGGTNGSVAGAIVNNATLVLNRSDAWSLPNTISGTGTLAKAGVGTVTLTAVGGWSGGTVISAGGVVSAQSQALGTGSVQVNSNAVLSLGAAYLSSSDTLNTGNLTLEGGRLRLDLGGMSTSDGRLSDSFNVVGNLALNGTNTVQLDFADGLPSTNGYYTLIGYSGTLSGGAANLIVSQATRMTAALDVSVPNEIRVRFSGSGSNLVWQGDGVSNQWDLGVSTNWFNGAGRDVFVQGDSVMFDDSGSSNAVVALSGSAAPSAVCVTGAVAYTLAGPGAIVGGASLVKNSPATLVITANNTFTGLTRVVSGALQLGSGGSSGGVGGTILNDGDLTINRSDYLTFSNSISGTGTVRKTGGSTMRIYGNNVYSGATTVDVSNGLELAGSPNLSAASDLILNGILDLWMYGGTVKSLSGTGTAFANSGLQTLTVGANDGSGTFSGILKNYLWNTGASLALTKTGGGTQTLSGTNTYTGATTVNGGVLKVTGQIYKTGGFFGTPGIAYIYLTSGGTLEVAQFEYGAAKPLSELRNNYYAVVVNGGRIRITATEQSYRAFSIGNQGATLEVGAGAKFTKLAGSIVSQGVLWNSGEGSLTLGGEGDGEMQDALGSYGTWGPSAGLIKAGPGTWTLTGTNTYAGGTVVSNGNLVVSTGTLGTGAVTVRGGAVLQLQKSTAIDDGANVALGYNGTTFGKVDLAAGVAETVDSLEVNGRSLPAGTYGATGSGAEHISDLLFSGTGQLIVLRGAHVFTGAVLQVR